MSKAAARSPAWSLPEASLVMRLARAVAEQGGRVVVVGGWVRDRLHGEPSKDLDLEIFGLSPESISNLLRPFGFSDPVGQHFPVWRETRHGVDVNYPRAGSDLFSQDRADSLGVAFREASRHRDLTINAIGWDPLGSSHDDADPLDLLDPWQGRADLAHRRLRFVDRETFGTDPLRVLRVARLSARFDARVDPGLIELCRGIKLAGLPIERIATELRRILRESSRPSQAFDFLAQIDHLDVFPPIAALRDVPQDPRWHPEGDVYVHTMQVVDCAAEIAAGLSESGSERLLFAALCHDLGKPETTTVEKGRIRSIGHEGVGAKRTREWLDDLRLPGRTVQAVEALVAHHLAPAQFATQNAGPRAYRRLARKLAPSGVTLVELERVARADHLGRSTAGSPVGRFEAGTLFLEAAEAAQVREAPRPLVVRASALIARGIEPGPELGRLLARCQTLQDETGQQDPEVLVDRVLAERE